MMTTKECRALYTVLSERQVKAVDEDLRVMSGIEYDIADDISDEYKSYIVHTYKNVLIYKQYKSQCIAVFPRRLKLLYNE